MNKLMMILGYLMFIGFLSVVGGTVGMYLKELSCSLGVLNGQDCHEISGVILTGLVGEGSFGLTFLGLCVYFIRKHKIRISSGDSGN